MNKLIPLVFLLIGIGGGVGAGLALRSAPDAETGGTADSGHGDTAKHDSGKDATKSGHGGDDASGHSDAHSDDGHAGSDAVTYVKLNNQFVVPIVNDDNIDALIVMSLGIEVPERLAENVYLREPKLRDLFLQVMFDHANMGGFRGTFTDTGKLDSLRRGFLDVAQSVLGDEVTAVLITDLARQSM